MIVTIKWEQVKVNLSIWLSPLERSSIAAVPLAVQIQPIGGLGRSFGLLRCWIYSATESSQWVDWLTDRADGLGGVVHWEQAVHGWRYMEGRWRWRGAASWLRLLITSHISLRQTHCSTGSSWTAFFQPLSQNVFQYLVFFSPELRANRWVSASTIGPAVRNPDVTFEEDSLPVDQPVGHDRRNTVFPLQDYVRVAACATQSHTCEWTIIFLFAQDDFCFAAVQPWEA